MAFISILLIGLLWVSGSTARPNADGVDIPANLQNSDDGCVSSSECGSNQFCSGRGKLKRCVQCIDCSLYQRKPRFNYDGIFCATHHSDCGGCNDGYEEIGGVCAPKVTTAKYTSVTTLDAFAYLKKSNAVDELEEASGLLTLVLILLLVTSIVCFLVPHEKHRVFSYFQRCNFSKGFQQKPTVACTARAPVEQPSAPPYYNYGESFRESYVPPTAGSFVQPAQSVDENTANGFHSIFSPLIIPVETQQAVPFNPGNGASDYIFESGTEGNNEANAGVDEADNRNGPESQSSLSNNVPLHDERSSELRPSESSQSHQQPVSNSNNSPSASTGATTDEPNPSQRDTEDQQVQPRVEVQGLEGAGAESRNAGENPIVFQFGVRVDLALFSPPQTSNRNPSSAENPATIATRYVAPASVSPRIDDLIVLQPLTELQGTFAGSPSQPDNDIPPLVPDFYELVQEEN